MSIKRPVAWTWRADPSPPEPEAAVAWHDTARALHARLARLPSSQLERLQACGNGDVLIIVGASGDLPWIPGIAYAARCTDDPALWRPTVVRPSVPIDLLARALKRRHAREPLLLWHEPAGIVPLDRQQRVSDDLLARFAERWRAA